MRENGRADRFNEKAKRATLPEKQQEERSGLSKEERMAAILRAWKESKDSHEFVHALEEEGFYLARGDKRDYVVIDRAGEVHSLSRQLAGTVKSKEIKALLATDYHPDKLPDVETARAHARQMRDYMKEEKESDRGLQEKVERLRQQQEAHRRDALARDHQARRARLESERRDLLDRMAAERQALADLQNAEREGVIAARKPPGRIIAFLSRITGIQALIDARRQRHDAARDHDHARQAEALAARHNREQQEMTRRDRNLAAIEAREKHSLETALAREEFQRVIEPAREITPEFTRAAEPEPQRDLTDAGGEKEPRKSLFNRIAGVFRQKTITPEFEKAAALPVPEPREEDERRQTPDDDLAEALRRRANRKDRDRDGPER
jgi:hypothetical protein